MTQFRGVDTLKREYVPFEAGDLPVAEKEQLCRQLLAEFGVTNVRTTPKHELIHSCCLPFGGHSNGDRNPSAALNFERLTYHCYGCGNGGGLLWFIGNCRGTDDDLARKWLREQTGTGADDMPLSVLLDFFDRVYGPKDRYQAPPIPKMDARVLTPWLAIHPYMTEIRGVAEETIKKFMVGWNPETNRIVIPLFWDGSLAGWQTRRLLNDGTAKYLNSPDFPRDQAIYNYDPSRNASVVESPLTTLALHHCEPAVEATFGAKVTDRQIRLLAAHKKVVLWYDHGDAGWNATRRVAEALEPYSSVWVVDNPYGADGADMVKSGRTDLALDLLANPVPYAVWSPPKEVIAWEEVLT